MDYKLFQCIQTIETNAEGVRSLTISPDGRILISGNWDRTIKFWRMSNFKEIQTWKVHQAAVTVVAISTDGQTLASGSWDDTVKIYDIGKGQLLHTWESYTEEANPQISSVVFSRDGKTLYIASQGGSAYYLDVETGKQLGSLGPTSTGCSHFAISTNGVTLAGAYLSKLVIRELPSRKKLHEIRTDLEVISSIAVSSNGETIISGHHSGEIYLWDTHKGEKFPLPKGHSDIVKSLAVSSNGRILASGGKDRKIILWDLSSCKKLCSLSGHLQDILTLTFSHNNCTLVSGSMDSTIKIWGVA